MRQNSYRDWIAAVSAAAFGFAAGFALAGAGGEGGDELPDHASGAGAGATGVAEADPLAQQAKAPEAPAIPAGEEKKIPPMPEHPVIADIDAATPEEIAALNEAFETVSRYHPEELAAWVRGHREKLVYLSGRSGNIIFQRLLVRDFELAMTFFEDGVVSLDREVLARLAFRQASRHEELLIPLFNHLSDGPFKRQAELGMTNYFFNKSASPIEGFHFLLGSELWDEVSQYEYIPLRRSDGDLLELLENGFRNVELAGEVSQLNSLIRDLEGTDGFENLLKISISNSRHIKFEDALARVPDGSSELKEWALASMRNKRPRETLSYLMENPAEFDALSEERRTALVGGFIDRNPGEAMEYFARRGELFELDHRTLEFHFRNWASMDLIPAFEFYQQYADQLEANDELKRELREQAEKYEVDEILLELSHEKNIYYSCDLLHFRRCRALFGSVE